MKKLVIPLLAAVFGCICSAASAQTVRINTYQGTNSSPTSSTTASSGSSISINVDYQISRICIFTDGGGSSANIGAVSVNHTGGTVRSSELQVILMDRSANQSFPNETFNLSPVATNWAGISFDTGTASYATVSGSISGNLTGALSAHKIVRVEVGGELSAAVSATATSEAIGWFEMGSSTSAGTITTTSGDITKINATSSSDSVEGEITAAGTLLEVVAVSDISIASGGIAAAGIGEITAASITSDITSANDIDGLFTTSGDYTGNISADWIPYLFYPFPAIEIQGDFHGTITLTSDLDGDILIHGELILPPPEDDGLFINVGGNLSASIVVDGDLGSIHFAGGADGFFSGYSPPRISSASGALYEVIIGGDIDGGYSILADTFIGHLAAANLNSVHIGNSTAHSPPLPIPIWSFEIEYDVNGVIEAEISTAPYAKFTIGNDFSGSMALSGVPESVPVKIGGSLEGDIEITGSSGLEGQIVINAANSSGTWDGDVTIDHASTTLSPTPYYNDLSTDFGGGAVGLVPFHLHGAEVHPTSGTYAIEWNSTESLWQLTIVGCQLNADNGVVLPFYGFVGTSSANTKPVRLYRHFGSDISDMTGCLSETVSASSSSTSRQIVIKYPEKSYGIMAGTFYLRYHSNGSYSSPTIGSSTCSPPSPVTLYSAGLLPGVTLPSVASFDLKIVVIPDCDTDCNYNPTHDDGSCFSCSGHGALCIADFDDGSNTGTCDDAVTIDDLLFCLYAFTQGHICADLDDGSDQGVPDSDITIDDLLFYLEHFANGC